MEHTDRISQKDLSDILRKLREPLLDLWTVTRQEIPSAPPELGKSFPLWKLEPDKIEQGDWPDLHKWVKPTDRWHHQINFSGKAKCFVRSTAPKDPQGSRSVSELSPSSLVAERIDDAINWVDQHSRGDLLAGLLTVPAYQVTAVWLFDESKRESHILVIEFPAEFTELKPLELLSSHRFLEVLSKQRPIIGISDRRKGVQSMPTKTSTGGSTKRGTKLTGGAMAGKGSEPRRTAGRLSGITSEELGGITNEELGGITSEELGGGVRNPATNEVLLDRLTIVSKLADILMAGKGSEERPTAGTRPAISGITNEELGTQPAISGITSEELGSAIKEVTKGVGQIQAALYAIDAKLANIGDKIDKLIPSNPGGTTSP